MDIGPEIEPHPHHHTGRQWVDVVLGVSVILISLISLMLAVENGNAMKRLVQANSWPFVIADTSNTDENGAPLLGFRIQNKGVGPAKIQSLEVFYKDKPMPNPRTLIHTILGPSANGAVVHYIASSVVGNVLSSKEAVTFFSVKDKSINPKYLQQLADANKDIGFRTCYCSVFDECWTLNIVDRLAPPQPIKTCPIPKVPFDL
jgi:hypothetical protein